MKRITYFLLLPLFLMATTSTAGTKTYTCRIVDFGHDLGDGYYRDHANSAQTQYKIDVDGDGDENDDCIAFWEFSLTQPINSQSYKYIKSATNSKFYGGVTALYNATGNIFWKECSMRITN